MAVPKKKKSKSKSASTRAGAWKLAAPARSVCPRCGQRRDAAHRVPVPKQEPRRRRRRLITELRRSASPSTPWGRRQGARRDRRRRSPRSSMTASESCSSVHSDLEHDDDIPPIPASELIAMDEDPGAAVRNKKDSTLVRAAEAVRDGNASAMISAGNTGATMASALLRTAAPGSSSIAMSSLAGISGMSSSCSRSGGPTSTTAMPSSTARRTPTTISPGALSPPSMASTAIGSIECVLRRRRRRRGSCTSRRTGTRCGSVCPRCGQAKTPHTRCGWYKNRVAVDVAQHALDAPDRRRRHGRRQGARRDRRRRSPRCR